LPATKATGSVWLTAAFLIAFGAYLVKAGFGSTYRYIEFSGPNIRLKRNPLLPAHNYESASIEKITVFPLKFIIRQKNSEQVLVRFGVTYPDVIEQVKDELLKYAENYGVKTEICNE
jgi:hypothetical protein